jgi:acetylornithine/succinyldiaminopimelate/putrescine aminotransferase
MIIEPVQGEGGVVPAPDGYLAELLGICHDAGALLIVDEIQTGIGRTGRWFAFERAGIVPDIVTLGKGLGGGMPIAGFMATDAVMDTMAPGDHGGTYAGNLVTCRAAQTVLEVIERDGLVERAERLGSAVRARLDAIAERLPQRIEGARGLGLLQALVFRDGADATDVHARAREAGVLTSLTAERVIRVFPALNIPEPELDRGVDLLEGVIDGAK